MKTIKTKIMACIIGCSLITALIVGALSIKSTMRITESEAVQNMNVRGDSVANEMDATITRIETSVNILADVVVDKLDEDAFFSDKNYADGFTDSILDEVFKFSERTEGAITSYIRYNPEYSNPTSGCFLTRDSLTDPFTAVTPTDFTMYDPTDLAHVGWYYMTTNTQLLVQRALSPAKISSIRIDEASKSIHIDLESSELALAIGRGGSNILLAEQLSGYKIDVYRLGDQGQEDEEDVLLDDFADEIDGWIIEALKKIGCDTAKSVLALSTEEVMQRADLEEETVLDVQRILQAEFEN